MKLVRCNHYVWAMLLSSTAIMFSCTPTEETKTEQAKNSTATIEVSDPLPSWNDGNTKNSITSFVEDVTTEGSANFIPAADRIATFDNDGTLWSEKPIYFQLYFAIDRVKELSADHPEWKDQQPFKAVLENDMQALLDQGEKGLLEISMMTHSGMTESEFDRIATDWMASAEHPEKKKHFNELVYQPMIELIAYLQANDFKTFIVSGGGVDFMRPWTEEVYGISKDRVIGSTLKVEYDYNDGNPVMKKLPEFDFFDDKSVKPQSIQKFIGRKPVFAAGNSDGDLEMLRWTDSNDFESFQLYVHHTDSVREWAYDRDSHIGTLNKGLDEAIEKGWTFADMEKDWKVVYPFEMK